MSKNILRAVLLIIIIAITTIVLWFISAPQPVAYQGEVEANYTNVITRAGGKVETLFFDIGDTVEKGKKLLILSNSTLQARLAVAESQLKVARANKDKTYNIPAENNGILEANLKRAEADLALAKQALNRAKTLLARGVATKQDYAEINNRYEAALKIYDTVKATLETAVTNENKDAKILADAQLEHAQAEYNLIQLENKELTIYAPISGQIISKAAQTGQIFEPNSPLFSIVDMSNVWLAFNLPEADLKGLSVGKEFDVTIPALDNRRITVKVTSINTLEQSDSNWKTNNEGNIESKSIELRAKPVEPIENLQPGMTINIVKDSLQ